ncbi:trypsin beta-like [Teleopsis dalmanni]|uniref:trypsin beta-like n=1 Tax=Teleopsis dalmanni TaxID=139649 RepID=UPI0018CCE617|nr:trypsin beta-like [Teleopsis dalmanni]
MFLKSSICGVLLVLGLFQTVQVKCAAVAPKIIGGTTTTISQAPFIIQLIRNGQTACGGVLIETNKVLTAAHCVAGITAADIQVLGGTTNLNSGGVRRKVTKIIRSKLYNTDDYNMDIAMLHLASALTGTNIATIALGTTPLADNVVTKVWGWGIADDGTQSNVLRVVDISTLSRTSCSEYYSLTTSNFCAFTSGKDACFGDSGGPLTHNNKLYGLVSYGAGCGTYPGVYTSIASTPIQTFITNAKKA